MFKLRQDSKIYVSLEPVDMRRAIDGLCVLVVEALEQSPQSGHVFLFCNKKRDKVKALYWDKNGFILHYKRLERHKFKFPRVTDKRLLTISDVQLQGLLAGLDFMLMGEFSEISYDEFY